MFGSSFSPVVCRRVPVLFMLFAVFDVRLSLQLFVGGFLSYLCYLLCLMFGSSFSPVVCRRVPVLFMLFVVFDVRFVFLSSCL